MWNSIHHSSRAFLGPAVASSFYSSAALSYSTSLSSLLTKSYLLPAHSWSHPSKSSSSNVSHRFYTLYNMCDSVLHSFNRKNISMASFHSQTYLSATEQEQKNDVKSADKAALQSRSIRPNTSDSSSDDEAMMRPDDLDPDETLSYEDNRDFLGVSGVPADDSDATTGEKLSESNSMGMKSSNIPGPQGYNRIILNKDTYFEDVYSVNSALQSLLSLGRYREFNYLYDVAFGEKTAEFKVAAGVLPNKVSYSLALSLASKAADRYGYLASKVLKHSKKNGVQLISGSYDNAMKCFMIASQGNNALALLERMKNEDPPSQPTTNTYSFAIQALCNAGEMEKATALVQEMRDFSVKREDPETIKKPFENQIRVTGNIYLHLLKGYLITNEAEKAFSMFKNLQSNQVKIPFALSARLALVCAENNFYSTLLKVLESMTATIDPFSNVELGFFERLLLVAARGGLPDIADAVWTLFQASLHVEPDQIHNFNQPTPHMIYSYIQTHATASVKYKTENPQWFALCFEKIHELRNLGHPPRLSNLSPFAKNLALADQGTIDRAYKYLQDTYANNNADVELAELNCVMQALALQGDTTRVLEIANDLSKEFKLLPDIETVNAMLYSLYISGHTSKLPQFSSTIEKWNIPFDSESYNLMLLLNIKKKSGEGIVDCARKASESNVKLDLQIVGRAIRYLVLNSSDHVKLTLDHLKGYDRALLFKVSGAQDVDPSIMEKLTELGLEVPTVRRRS